MAIGLAMAAAHTAMDPAVSRALRLADEAVAKQSPGALQLVVKALEQCEKAKYTANVRYARTWPS